jgi:hypothetical protein
MQLSLSLSNITLYCCLQLFYFIFNNDYSSTFDLLQITYYCQSVTILSSILLMHFKYIRMMILDNIVMLSGIAMNNAIKLQQSFDYNPILFCVLFGRYLYLYDKSNLPTFVYVNIYLYILIRFITLTISIYLALFP